MVHAGNARNELSLCVREILEQYLLIGRPLLGSRSSRLGTGVAKTSLIRTHTWCNVPISLIMNLCSLC